MNIEQDSEFLKKQTNSAYFYKQISLIQNQELKDWITHYLDNHVQKFNLERPSSSTGKYHPDCDKGYGGNGRHAKMLCKFVSIFVRARPDFSSDNLYAAAILHDCSKYITDEDKYTNADHAELMHNKIIENYKSYEKKSKQLSKSVKRIAQLVNWHMGRFDPRNADKEQIQKGYMKKAVKNMGFDEEVWTLHYCDMLAAAQDIDYENF